MQESSLVLPQLPVTVHDSFKEVEIGQLVPPIREFWPSVSSPPTIALDHAHDGSVGTITVFLFSEILEDQFVVTNHDGQLVAHSRAKHPAVLLGHLHEANVLLAAHERQEAEHGDAPGARRQGGELVDELNDPLEDVNED